VLRLLAWLLGFLALALPVAAITLFVVAVAGSPGECDSQGREIVSSSEDALAFQVKWDQFNSTLDAGQVSTVIFSESEATSRGRVWVDEHDLPVDDLLLCFNTSGGSASGKLEIPFLWGDVDVLVTGRMELIGDHPVAVIEDVEIGGIPSMLTGPVEDAVRELIDDETAKINLDHDYGVTFGEGEVTMSGQP
jgi:hypothetical protein